MEQNMSEIEQRMEALYHEITAKQNELTELKKAKAGPVADYRFSGPEGDVHLSEIFGGKDELILIHNMGSGCPMCTLWADGFNGIYQHLADRAAFAVVSPDSPERQREFAQSRGWRFPMYSDGDKSFSLAMGFAQDKEGKVYVYPGFSTFRKLPDGSIERTAYDFFGPGDQYGPAYPMFALLAGGVGEWFPRFRYDNQESN